MLNTGFHVICPSPYVVLVITDLTDIGILAVYALRMPTFEMTCGLQFSSDNDKLTVLIIKKSIQAVTVACLVTPSRRFACNKRRKPQLIFDLRCWENARKISDRRASSPFEIWTSYLPNTSQQRYTYMDILGVFCVNQLNTKRIHRAVEIYVYGTLKQDAQFSLQYVTDSFVNNFFYTKPYSRTKLSLTATAVLEIQCWTSRGNRIMELPVNCSSILIAKCIVQMWMT
jgi:hypothetical protein